MEFILSLLGILLALYILLGYVQQHGAKGLTSYYLVFYEKAGRDDKKSIMRCPECGSIHIVRQRGFFYWTFGLLGYVFFGVMTVMGILGILGALFGNAENIFWVFVFLPLGALSGYLQARFILRYKPIYCSQCGYRWEQ